MVSFKSEMDRDNLTFLSEITIRHLLKLHELAVAENADGEHIPANTVRHFLLAICTRPGLGICFRGWYPRDTDADFIDEPKKSGNKYFIMKEPQG